MSIMEDTIPRLSEKTRQQRKLAFVQLTERVEAIRQNPGSDESVINQVEDVYRESNELLEDAAHPDLMLMDANVLTIGMSVLKHTLGNIDPNVSSFDISEFLQKLLVYRASHCHPSNLGLEELDWSCLADTAATCFYRSPCLAPILGLFDQQVPPAVRKPRRPKEKPLACEKWTPEVVSALTVDAEGMEESIQDILKIIHRQFKRNGGLPLCLFKLIVDPTSYQNTVQNIFHFSFLVKDGFVDVKDDVDGTTLRITPINLRDTDAGMRKGPSQLFLFLSISKWQDVIQVYNITEAAISSSPTASKQKSTKRAQKRHLSDPLNMQGD